MDEERITISQRGLYGNPAVRIRLETGAVELTVFRDHLRIYSHADEGSDMVLTFASANVLNLTVGASVVTPEKDG